MLHVAYHWYFRNAVRLFVIAIVGAIVIEIAGRLIRRKRLNLNESATSLVSGVAFMATKSLVSKLVMLSLSLYVYRNFRLTTLNLGNSWVWVGVFLLRDFIYYWVHRVEHRVRVLWASHMIHHSARHHRVRHRRSCAVDGSALQAVARSVAAAHRL
jgi:sterol desaturase/sphingolipid hydroxylase (fatty acid hydroxylase superfamily)